jgi:hypothetical protein
MDLIKRPKKVQRAEKGYLTNEKYQDYSDEQFKNIYDKADEIITELKNIGEVISEIEKEEPEAEKKEKTLYENATGITTGNFELNDTIVNYKEIDIYYARSTGAFNKTIEKVEVSNTAGVNWFIPLTLIDDDGSSKYINSARLGIKDKTVTINGNTYNVKISSSGAISTANSPLLAIFKIVGYM